MNPQALVRTFVVECGELLEAMEASLLAVKAGDADPESINDIFRTAHTIKGAAGLLALDHVVQFAHAVESVLDDARENKLSLDGELVVLLLSCRDHLALLVSAVDAGRLDPDPETERHGASLLETLLRHRQAPRSKPALETGPPDGAAATVAADHWHLSLRFRGEALRNGMEPLAFIRYLEELGQIVAITTVRDALPPLAEMNPEQCYLGFEIALQSQADKAALAAVFELARDDCDVRLLPPRSQIGEYVRLIRELPEGAERLGEILVGCGSLTEQELELALRTQVEASPQPEPLGELLVRRGSLHPEVLDAALVKQQKVKSAKLQESRSVRVDADKLDQLINLVGELIIATASTNLVARSTRLPELQQCTATLTSLVEAVRDNALQLRMVKIGETFKRFQRVVYDVSRELGKDIALAVSGEDTELDKTVVEKIGDPLLHLVRNAMDHGIEPVATRAARGKPAKGTVRLNAYHDSGSIVIEVSDDGGGLKRDKILAKGLERGLVEPGRALSDGEIYNLIFEPGFSTAEQVTNLSGRGVGMDVVKRNIEALRGSVNVDSQEGIGTTVTVRLPLTLAIINGFLVGLGKSVFVVPLEMIEECMELGADADRDYTDLRGKVLPFIRLRQLFALEGPALSRQNVVVVRCGEQRAGLVVDTLLGEFQTVIKPLGKMFNRVKCISGSSILGNGEVALILDVPTLVQRAAQPSIQN
jgi:two-component system, chemotaxis family, sensor kinase CheA